MNSGHLHLRHGGRALRARARVALALLAVVVAALSVSGQQQQYEAPQAWANDISSTTPSQLSFGDFFSVDAATFFSTIYQQDTFVDNTVRQAQLLPALDQVVAPLGDVDALCRAFENQDKQTGGFHMKEQGETRQVSSCKQMEDELAAGAGLLIRYEDLVDFPAEDNVKQLQEGVRDVFGTESTVHLYHATQNESRALMPHTDPYDVLVIQLHGSKRWTTCIPDAYATSGSDDTTEDHSDSHPDEKAASSSNGQQQHGHGEAETIKQFNPAQLGQLQEIRRQKQEGCTRYEDRDLRGMRCNEFTLRAGDTMYMPKGIIHYAVSGAEGSSHLTISLERRGLAWADALVYAAHAGADIVDNTAFTKHWQRALQSLISDYRGVQLLEAMPSWHLNTGALCPSHDATKEKDDGTSEEGTTGGEEGEELTAFIGSFMAQCEAMQPHVLESYTTANDLEAFLNPDGIEALADRVCSEDTARAVVSELCAQGKMPVDVTSPLFRVQALRERRRRNTVTASYTCDSNCDTGCDGQSCSNCDDNCNSGCDDDCNECDASCDGCNGQSCTGSCDESCDRCLGSCDTSCDEVTGCMYYCDQCVNLPYDYYYNYYYDYRRLCYENCHVGYNCQPTSCDDSCNSNCNADCNAGCDSSCTPTGCNFNCDSSCDGPCDAGCDDSCDAGCDTCVGISCDDSCDGSCSCNAGYAGSGMSCSACNTPYYSPSAGASSCTPCGSCSSGQYRANCGGTSGGTCTSCASCPAGQERRGCSGTSPGGCANCNSGTYKTTQGTHSCSACGSCSAGYYLSGCGGTSAGSCVGIACTTPPTVNHASFTTSNSRKYPSTATYTCATGYLIESNDKLSCKTDGSWSGVTPHCIGVPCQELALDHGSVSPSGVIRHPNTASFSCEVGYELTDTAPARCQADGTWSAVPSCVGRLCESLAIPNHASVSYSNNRLYPTTATYTCDPGYEISTGDAQRQCIASTGAFGGTEATCIGITCNTLTPPDHGSITSITNNGRYPAQAAYACDPGYEPVGASTTIDCQTDASWSPEPPTCRGVLCADPNIANAQTTRSSERYPADATVACDPGHGMAGPVELTCSTAGTWGELPTCTQCPVDTYPPTPTEACVSCPAGTSTNGQAGANQCECIPGYEPSGDGLTCVPCRDNFFKGEFGNAMCEPCAAGYQTENSDFTQCVGVPCDPIPDIEFGDPTSTESVRYPAVIPYVCELGFHAVDDLDTITCNTDGTWTQIPSCTYTCGDGMIVEGEECDDGDPMGGDGCSADCKLEDTHACIEQGKDCVYCNFTSRPEPLALACDDPDFAFKVDAWASIAGSADVLDHEHCGPPTFTYMSTNHTAGHLPNCYKRLFDFHAVFNDGKVDEIVLGRLTVTDNNTPWFATVPERNVSAECHVVPPVANLTAPDVCIPDGGARVTATQTRVDGRCPYEYTLQRTWVADDGCGNTNSTQQVVSVFDSTAPVFDAELADQTLECGANVTRDVAAVMQRNARVQVTDNCSPTLTMETEMLGLSLAQCGGTGDVRFRVTATDQCGLSSQQDVHIAIEDTQPPVGANVPASVTAECSAVPPLAPGVFAVDACGERRYDAVTAEERVDGACAHAYVLRRTFTFTDVCSNSITYVQNVTVRDTTGPRITRQPDPLRLECDGEDNEAVIQAWLDAHGGAEAEDKCSSADQITWHHDYERVQSLFEQTCRDVVNVTFMAVDDCGQGTPVSAAIVLTDTRPPVFLEEAEDQMVTCDVAVTMPAPRAYDNCTGEIEATYTDARMDGACPFQYGVVRTWVAVDGCGLNATTKHALTVTDNIPPAISKPAVDTVVECVAENNTRALQMYLEAHGYAEAREPCGEVAWFYSDRSVQLDETSGPLASQDVNTTGGCSTTFTADVTFYAVDECNNVAPTSATFTIADRVGPVPVDTLPAVLPASCDAVPGIPDLRMRDACSTKETVVSGFEERVDGRCPHTYDLKRTWLAEDDCLNTGTAQQTVEVSDTTGPRVVQAPTDLHVDCNGETDAQVQAWLDTHGNAMAVDNCDENSADLTWTHNYEEVRRTLQRGCGNNNVTVTFTVRDLCGNPTRTTAQLIVADTTPPFFTRLPSHAQHQCDADTNEDVLQAFIEMNGGAVAADLCSATHDLAWTHSIEETTTCGMAANLTVRFTATDRCNNSASASAVIAFVDTEKPHIELYGDNPMVADYGYTWLDPSVRLATDRCHSEVTAQVSSQDNVNTSAIGDYTVVYRVADPCGHVQTATRTVEVRDTEPPKIRGIGPQVLFIREGTVYVDEGATAWDNYWPTVKLDGFVVVNGMEQTNLTASASIAGSESFTVTYRAVDGSGNEGVRHVRTVFVLPPPDHGTATATATFVFDTALSVRRIEPAARTASGGAYYVVRAVVTSPTERVVPRRLRLQFGGEIHGYAEEGTIARAEAGTGDDGHEVQVILGEQAGDGVRAAQELESVLATGATAVRVVSFHGSTLRNPWFCGGVTLVDDILSREGRTVVDAQCDGCLCTYVARQPSAGDEFDVPRLEASMQWHVTVRALRAGEDIDLDHLKEKLVQFGVVPVRVQHGGGGAKDVATFVTRSRVPGGPNALWPARVSVVSVQPVVATQLVLEVSSGVRNVTLLSSLYAARIVPETVEFAPVLGRPARATLTLTTHNDVTEFVLLTLADVGSSWMHRLVSVSYVAPTATATPSWPFNYTLCASDDAQPEEMWSVWDTVTAALGLRTEVDYTVYSFGVNATCFGVATQQPLATDVTSQLLHVGNFSRVDLTTDNSVDAAIHSSFQQQLMERLPFPASSMMFSMDSEGASQSLRRDSQLSITVTFTDPPEPTLLAGGSPGYVIPDTRYSLQFEVDTTTDDLPTTTTSTTTTTTTTTAATTTITTTAAGAGGAGNSTITNSTAITTTNSTSASNATAISTTSTTTTTLEPTTTMTTLEDMVRSRALRALNDIGIPIIDISIDGTKVSVVAVEFPTSSMMMDLDDHPYVALNTTRPPLTLNSALTAEDAIELALRLVQAHVVQPRWGSFEFPVELLESAFTTTTTTTTTTSTTTTTTTSPTSQDNSSSTTPTQSPDAPKASSSTAASPWQFAVGAFGGVVLIAAIVGFIMVTRRRSVVGTSPTVVSDIKQRPTVSFTNPVYEDGLKKDATMHSHNGDLYTDVGDRDEQLYDEPAALFGTTHQVFNPIYSAKSTENVFGDDEDEDEVDPDGGYLDVSEQAQDVAEYTDVHVAADDDATYATGFGFSDDEDE